MPALAAADPLRLHLDPPAVVTAGRCLVAGMVECLPQAGSAPAPAGGSIAERLITRLCPDAPRAGMVDVLRSTLVLLADHELAASTLAARVAASVRADPYAVVATGLGAVGGALHGGASFGAETMLRSAVAPRDAQRVVGELLRRGERIPGFGHFVYQGSDPRGVFVFERLRQVAPDSERLAVAQAVMTEAQQAGAARAEHRLRSRRVRRGRRDDPWGRRGDLRGGPGGRLGGARPGAVWPPWSDSSDGGSTPVRHRPFRLPLL